MFLLFKKKSRQEQNQQDSAIDKAAAGIVHRCIRIQTEWANYMHRKTVRLSYDAKKYWLILYCLTAGGCSLNLIVESFRSNNHKMLLVVSIHVPVHTIQTGDEKPSTSLMISKAEFQRIEGFRHYMDSLGQSMQGKKVRDSTLLSRPGLMDSIHVIENLYQLQSSKK